MEQYLYSATIKPAFDKDHVIKDFPTMSEALIWTYHNWPLALSVNITMEPVVNKTSAKAQG